ncbi:hypothetical protein P8452_39106 [Trifolium repens]|nr:hypothetical protein P8452_39106 [Trifolium repens]
MASSSKGNGVDKDNEIRNPRDSFARSLTKENDKYCARPAETQEIRLRIYHGGLFVDSPCKMYVKGQMDEMNWGVDFTSYKDVVELVKSLGYRDFKRKWKTVDEEVVIDVDDEYEGDGDYEDEVEGGSDEVEGGSDKVDLNDTEDEDYVADNEEVSDDYTIDESDFEGNWDWTSVLPEEMVKEVHSNVGPFENVMNLNPKMRVEFEAENDDSDILITPPGSEDDEATVMNFPTFRMPNDDEIIKFGQGMKFTLKSIVKGAVKQCEKDFNWFFY